METDCGYEPKNLFERLRHCCAVACCPAGDGDKRPNILFVFADQLRSMELGCYGGKQISTPHMDRVAREGAFIKTAIRMESTLQPNSSVGKDGCIISGVLYLTGIADTHTLGEWLNQSGDGAARTVISD